MRTSGLDQGYSGAEIPENRVFRISFGTARGMDKGWKNPGWQRGVGWLDHQPSHPCGESRTIAAAWHSISWAGVADLTRLHAAVKSQSQRPAGQCHVSSTLWQKLLCSAPWEEQSGLMACVHYNCLFSRPQSGQNSP
jgi:hypothetical protein